MHKRSYKSPPHDNTKPYWVPFQALGQWRTALYSHGSDTVTDGTAQVLAC